jgi:hypothetical protein
MSVYLDQTNDEIYFGHLKVATAAAYPGDVVVADDSAGTCAAPGSDTVADGTDLYMVCNYDSYADTDMTNSKDYDVAVGKYARLKQLSKGDVFTTDRFIGTYSSIAVDDIFAVNGTAGSGAVGKWIAVASRTPELKAKVIEKTYIYGQEALKMRVIGA